MTKIAKNERGKRRVLVRMIFTVVILLLVVSQILADDVLLNLPKNFDVTIKRVWHRNKNEGYREYSEKDIPNTEDRVLHFRGKIVTQDIDRTERRPLSDGSVNIVRLITKLRATYEKGHLSGTWESHNYTRIQGSKNCNDAEHWQEHYKATVTGEANADGILKITVQNIDETSLTRESTTQLVGSGKDARTVTIFGGGWKKSNQERNLYSWGAEYQLPVGELQSSQKFIPEGKTLGEQTQGEETPSGPDTRVSGSDQSSSSQEGPAPVTPGEAAAGAGVVGAIAAVGAWLTMLSSGVKPRDVMDALGGLFGTAPPPEPTPVPPVAEPPRILFQEPPHKDGDVNETGEVWSNEDRGWVGRNLYEQEKARPSDIADRNAEALQAGQSEDVKRAYDRWLDSKQKLADMREAMRQSDIDLKRGELQRLESQSDKGYNWHDIHVFFGENLARDCKDIYSLDTWKQAGEDTASWGRDVLIATKDTAGDLLAHPLDSGRKIGDFYHTVVADLSDWAGEASIDGKAAAKRAAKFGKELAKPITDIVDPNKPIMDRFAAVAKLEVMTVAGHGMQAGVARIARGAEKLINGAGKMMGMETPIVTEGGAVAGKAAETGAGAAPPKDDWLSRQRAGRAKLSESYTEEAIKKLPPDHPAFKVGEVNETLSKAGSKYNSRMVNAKVRLNPDDPIVQKGVDGLALEKKFGTAGERIFTKDAERVMDAVRHNLDLKSRELGAKLMYEAHPELKGAVKGWSNTGSHARKGFDYRNLSSDIDLTPITENSARGAKAAELLGEYQKKALGELTDKRLTMNDLKINNYGDPKTAGRLTSQGGQKFKTMLDEVKGRVDVVNEEGQIVRSYRGDDPVILGREPTRWTTGSVEGDATQFRGVYKDFHVKHLQESPGMPTPEERFIQAGKNLNVPRQFELKNMGGAAPVERPELYQIAKNAKKIVSSGNYTTEQLKTWSDQILKELETRSR